MLKQICLGLLLAAALSEARAAWTLTEGTNNGGPGSAVEVKLDGKLSARFVHGAGQFKPYLHVFGEDGKLLTNAGLDASGKADGLFPHHRGIYIGWNKITSDLGAFDLWHFNNGGKMNVAKFEKLEGGRDAATLVATIEWRGGKKDAAGSDLLLTETRTLVISRPEGKRTQVDARFELKAARDLTLGGDLQHAGIHFRGAKELPARKTETSYLWQPDLPGPGGKVSSTNLQWCRLLFPIGAQWYTSTVLNAPANPVEDLSWRDYGRFGFFFKKSLPKDETLRLNYRFLTERVAAPANQPKPSPEQSKISRTEAQAQYDAFVKSLQQAGGR